MRIHPPLPLSPEAEIEEQRIVWQGRYAAAQTVRFRNRRFDGTLSPPRTWEVWRRGHAAAVLPYDPRTDEVVLIDQFRITAVAACLPPVMVEIPAGLCEANEDPAETIRRESVEEAHLAIRRLKRIGKYILSSGGSDESLTLFAGETTAPHADTNGHAGLAGLESESEDIRIRVWPAAEAIAQAFAGKLPNAVTSLALFWLASQRATLQQEWKE